MAEHVERVIGLQLDKRGIPFQVAALAVYGFLVTGVLTLYSETGTLHIRYLEVVEIGTTQFSWVFAPLVVYTVEKGRSMFNTRAETRAAVRAKVREEGLEQGRKEMMEWMRSKFEERGKELDPEIEEEAKEYLENGRS